MPSVHLKLRLWIVLLFATKLIFVRLPVTWSNLMSPEILSSNCVQLLLLIQPSRSSSSCNVNLHFNSERACWMLICYHWQRLGKAEVQRLNSCCLGSRCSLYWCLIYPRFFAVQLWYMMSGMTSIRISVNTVRSFAIIMLTANETVGFYGYRLKF